MLKGSMRIFGLLIVTLLLTSQVFALLAGELDPLFGNGGFATLNMGDVSDFARDIVRQTDGKYVVAGSSFNGANDDFAVARFNVDGTLDTTFGIGGYVRTDFDNSSDYATSLALQSDGKIVVVGYTGMNGNNDFALARYLTSGVLDTTFGNAGKVVTVVSATYPDVLNAVEIDSNGKIVVAGAGGRQYGYNDAIIARYNSNGTSDATFGTSGLTRTTSTNTLLDLVIDGAGKILATSSEETLIRLLPTGSFDTTFDGDGLMSGRGHGIALYPGGKYVTTTDYYGSIRVRRLNNNGTLDTSFSEDGYTTMSMTSGDLTNSKIAVDGTGRLVVAGQAYGNSNYSGFVARFNTNGSFDTTFSGDGLAVVGTGTGVDRFSNLVINPDNSVVAAGWGSGNGIDSDFLVAKFLGVELLPPAAFSLTGPANNTFYAIGQVPNPLTFTWQVSSGATHYTFALHAGNFGTLLVSKTGLTGPLYTLTGPEYALLGSGTYSWIVTAHGSGGSTQAISGYTFEVGMPAAPSAFNLGGPATNVNYIVGQVPNPLTFSWEVSTGATSYTFKLNKNGLFGTELVTKTGLTGPVYTLTDSEYALLVSGAYNWTVTAHGPGGNRAANQTNYIYVVTPNLLQNSGFETQGFTVKTAESWVMSAVVSGDRRICNKPGKSFSYQGNCALQFKTSVSPSGRTAKQTLITPLVGANDYLSLSAMVSAKNLVGKGVIVLKVVYPGAPMEKIKIPINAGTYGYTIHEDGTWLAQAPSKVIVNINAKTTTGRILIDSLNLYTLPGTRAPQDGNSVLPPPDAPTGFRR